MPEFHKSILPNKIRVVTEKHPESRAVSIGLWVMTGTRHETPDQSGVSHFLEHLVFKGTKTRNAFEIAKSLEELGGELNAYTTKEYTCYHALVLKDHWKTALEVIADLAINMRLTQANFNLEKSVVMQEIAMSEDSIEDIIYDHYFELAYGKHPVARRILGTEESIGKMKMKQVQAYYKDQYGGANLILSAAGNLDHDAVTKEFKKHFNKRSKGRLTKNGKRPTHKTFRKVIEKPSEQVHILMGFPATSFCDDHRFEAFILNALLGGGMTSKLYQSIRENKGLVYSIHSSLNTFVDFGIIFIHAATDEGKVKEVVGLIKKELTRLKDKGVTESDLKLFKKQLTGSILLGADDMENRMTSLGVNEMVFSRYRPVEEVINEIESITVKSVNEYVKKHFKTQEIGGLLMGGGVLELEKWWNETEI